MAGGSGFWSGETLGLRLKTLIKPYNAENIDCAAYTLSMGPEVYVSPSEEAVDPNSVSIRQLSEGEAFTIPPGQFAFLLSEEMVEVPSDALAFISIKAKTKFRGLINVSGFHVDPGFVGRLIFAVFNAGPIPVHLRQGQPLFLIWYAYLDKASKLVRKQPVQEHISADFITAIAGELQSFAGINEKIKTVQKDLTDRVHAIEREQGYYRLVAALVLAVVIAIFTAWIKDGGLSPRVEVTPTSNVARVVESNAAQAPLNDAFPAAVPANAAAPKK